MVVRVNKETAEIVVLRRICEALRPPNELLVAELTDGNWVTDVQESLGELGMALPAAWGTLTRVLARPRREILAELTAEYTRLFINDYGQTPAPPYASVYLPTCSQGGSQVALQVSEWYSQAGMALPPDYPEPHDSLGVELEFLIYLHQSIAEAGTGQASKYLRTIKGDFYANHLAKWIPCFARRVRAADAHLFYAVVVELLTAVVAAGL